MTSDLEASYVTSGEAARILGVHPVAVGQWARNGRIPAVKMANRWFIPRAALEKFAKDYTPGRGRPRTKRKYTKRSPRWFKK